MADMHGDRSSSSSSSNSLSRYHEDPPVWLGLCTDLRRARFKGSRAPGNAAVIMLANLDGICT